MSTHDYLPDAERFHGMFSSDKQSPVTDRTYAAYLAVLLIGQRTPEEIVILADYLQTGKISEWRSG